MRGLYERHLLPHLTDGVCGARVPRPGGQLPLRRAWPLAGGFTVEEMGAGYLSRPRLLTYVSRGWAR